MFRIFFRETRKKEKRGIRRSPSHAVNILRPFFPLSFLLCIDFIFLEHLQVNLLFFHAMLWLGISSCYGFRFLVFPVTVNLWRMTVYVRLFHILDSSPEIQSWEPNHWDECEHLSCTCTLDVYILSIESYINLHPCQYVSWLLDAWSALVKLILIVLLHSKFAGTGYSH